MIRSKLVLAALSLSLSVTAYAASETDFKLALVNHAGQLSWSAGGYKIVQSSAKPTVTKSGYAARMSPGLLFSVFYSCSQNKHLLPVPNAVTALSILRRKAIRH